MAARYSGIVSEATIGVSSRCGRRGGCGRQRRSASCRRAARLKQEAGKAVQSSHRWINVRGLIGGLTVLAVLGCDQRVDVLGSPPITREDAYSRQVALDVAAIVLGMTGVHGAQAVASLPKWWQDLPSHP